MSPELHCDRDGCRVSGELTLGKLDKLSNSLLLHAESERDMSLNLQQVSDCDSSFIATLIACQQIKKQQGNRLSLSECPPKIIAMMDVYGLADCGIEIN